MESTANHLTRLALCPEDVWTAKSTVPANPKWTAAENIQLDADESNRVRDMIEECAFTQCIVMHNFDARVGTILPPTGYAAMWNSDSLFVADCIDQNIFRCVQGISLQKAKRLNVHEGLAAVVNALIGDASPVPCVSRTQAGNWVCSLGSFAWIGIYGQPIAGRPNHAVVVVSGLDPASWAAMREEMYTEWHRQRTLREVYPRLLFWKSVARENGERLLATFTRAMNERPHDMARMNEITSCPAYESRASVTVGDEACEWLCKSDKNRIRVPRWFVFPSVAPRACDPVMPGEPGTGIRTDHDRTETVPWTTAPEFYVCVDDIVPFGDGEYVRLAGCCDTREPFRVILRGPNEDIVLIDSPGSPQPANLHAQAAQAIQHVAIVPSYAADDMQMTWEDAAITHNRMIDASYAFREGMEDEPEKSHRLLPVFVRVSCRDAMGRAVTMPKAPRLASLAMDDWIPIRR